MSGGSISHCNKDTKKRNMNKLLVLLLYFLLALHACADFDGLTDLKFGQVVDISDGNFKLASHGLKELTLTNTTFTPFVEWKVCITTTSHRVAQINSSIELDSQQKAVQERDRLVAFFKSKLGNAVCKQCDDIEQDIVGFDATGDVAKVAVVLQEGRSIAVMLGDMAEVSRARKEQRAEMEKRMPQIGHPKFNGLFGVDFMAPIPDDAFLEEINDGYKDYSYRLKKSFYGIKECTLSVTKKQGLVWSIKAEGEYSSLAEADKAKKAMVVALEKKYGIIHDHERDLVTFSYNPIPERDIDFIQNVMINSAQRGDKSIVSIWAIDFRGIDIMRTEMP